MGLLLCVCGGGSVTSSVGVFLCNLIAQETCVKGLEKKYEETN